jgi:hypothetical protein
MDVEPRHTKGSLALYKSFTILCFNPFFLQERLFGRKDCIEYANLRARALPKHEPNESGFTNISLGGTVTFTEHRPVRSAYYYLLLVSSAVVSFQLKLR